VGKNGESREAIGIVVVLPSRRMRQASGKGIPRFSNSRTGNEDCKEEPHRHLTRALVAVGRQPSFPGSSLEPRLRAHSPSVTDLAPLTSGPNVNARLRNPNPSPSRSVTTTSRPESMPRGTSD
jgi:hypothetical protein